MKRNPLAIKHRKIAKLANKALKDNFKIKPAKGYKFLKDIPIGSYFITPNLMKGILIECETNAKVIITEVPNIPTEDRNYYLGKHIIGATTEVKEIYDDE